MDGKTLALLGLTLVVVLMGGYMAMDKSSDETEIDQKTAELAQSNSSHIMSLREDIQGLTDAVEKANNKIDPGLDGQDVERIVNQVLASKGGMQKNVAATNQDEEVAAAKGDKEFNFNSTMASLMANPSDWDSRQLDWAKIKKAGKMDEAIAFLEERAKDATNDPEAHCDLAEGYIAKLQTAGSDFMMMAELAGKADKAFDRTLEIDDQHWRGRLQKAISLSFAPPIAGKQGEAIKHFKILADQQKTQAPSKDHAMTHMFLGNMYAQQGKTAEAKASWQEGLAADPDNAQLKKLISNAGGN